MWQGTHEIAELLRTELQWTRGQGWAALRTAERLGAVERRPSTGRSRYAWRARTVEGRAAGWLCILVDPRSFAAGTAQQSVTAGQTCLQGAADAC